MLLKTCCQQYSKRVDRAEEQLNLPTEYLFLLTNRLFTSLPRTVHREKWLNFAVTF